MDYRVEVWYMPMSNPPRFADEMFTARVIETQGPWLYLAHSDFEAYLPAANIGKIVVTEEEA